MKTLKKSLSLFLAVVMLLSCWVWVAPTDAEAAGYEDGQYYLKFVVSNISEAGNNDKWSGNTMTINYIKADGTNGSTTVNLDKSKYTSTGTNKVIWEGYVDGFPTSAGWYMAMGYQAFGSVYLNARGAYMLVGKDASNCNQSITARDNEGGADNFKWQQDAIGQGTKEGTFTISALGSAYPQIKTFSNGPAATATVNVPKIDTAAEDKKVFANNFSLKCYDQYGVRITNTELLGKALSFGFKTMNNENAEFDNNFTKEISGLWYDGGNVWYTKDIQALLAKKSETPYYLFCHFSDTRYGEKKQLISTIKFKYPTYTMTVDPNGSVKIPVYGAEAEDLKPNMDMSNGNTFSAKWEYTGVYSSTAASWPKGTASKDGYIFKGLWTKPQPTTADKDGNLPLTHYNTKTSEFIEPVSSEDFVKVYGGAEGGTTVTKNGKTYYNAGKQWNADVDKAATTDIDYYAWWVAEDITVKFYDVDGTYLGTQYTKHNSIEDTTWYPHAKDGYVAGAFEYKGFAGQWRDITGAVITEAGHQFSSKLKTLTLTPVYETKTYKETYEINFINPLTGGKIDPTPNNNIASGNYAYRHLLEGANIAPNQNVPFDIAYGYDYSYEFSGWSSQVPANGKYHTVLKDDTSFVENNDWIVRDDVTYYAVYRATVKEYVIAFSYIDTTGTENTLTMNVPYGATILTPDSVNRTYAFEGKGYNLLSWDYYDGADKDAVLDVDGVIVLNEENVSITDDNRVGGNETPVIFSANYDKGTPMPYTITFKYKNDKGVDKTYSIEVSHGSQITADKLADLVVPEQYDDGAALYTFANKWIVTEGASDKADYEANELTTFAPTSHVTFEAAYGEGVPFYTVTYVDGDKTFSERILKGDNVPAWVENDAVYIPTKENAETGEYVFAGWFDEKQTDKEFTATNGNEYTVESTVEGDLVLYPQFTFKPFTYEIKFVNYDGTVLAVGEFEAGADFEETLKAAEAIASKPADEKYYYTFIGWDYNPGNYVCGGYDMTYTAQYKPGYNTYKARWYASEGDMTNAAPDGAVGQDGLLAITSHIYEAAVYAPSVKLNILANEVFVGWFYKDGEDEKAYQRGMTITSDMSFYAKTETVEAEKTYTVTTYIGEEKADYTIVAGNTAEVIGEPLDGYVDETNHNKFIGWYTADGEEFEITTLVIEDIEVTARFEVSAHVMDQKELVTAPTYYATGSENVWCACDKDQTIEENVAIPMLQDTTAPTGTIYLGGQSWSSTDETGAAATDNDPISIRVNGKADVVITANDTGMGVKIIRAFAFPANKVLTAEAYGAAQQVALEVFRDDTQTINNNANYAVKLEDFEVAVLDEDGTPVTDADGNVVSQELQDGEAYIIYYYVNDKATTDNGAAVTGNQLNRKVRTAKFIYDTTAPEFNFTGDSNIATGTVTPTFCGQAIIRDIENDAKLVVNGKEIELTAVGVTGKTTYAINEAGNYVITITDVAGNSATKKIKVAASHSEVYTSKAVTCTEDGYEKITCAVCAKEIKNEVTPYAGHQYGDKQVIAATCTTDGYTYKTCSVCGDVEKSNITPKLNHVDQGETEVVTKKATCSATGSKTIYCAACNAKLRTEEIAIDDSLDGHNFGANKTKKATCAEDGEVYRQCKYCYTKSTIKTLDKLDHKDTGRYEVILVQATCSATGKVGTYCKVCDEKMSEADIDMIAHNLKLVKYETYMRYECQVCDYKGENMPIKVTATYTVTFGDKTITKNEGETIALEDVYAKDEDGNYVYPSQASDEYKNYTFAGWKGADGKIVNLPITVKKNETYVAAYTETKRTYTHTFKVNEDDQDAFAVILGTYNNENKKPSAIPTKPATATERYEFKYWTVAGAEVTDFTMTEDATFVAKFDTIETKFSAVFYNEGNNLIWHTSVTSNEAVKYGNTDANGLIIPTKAPDADFHYKFNKWQYAGNEFALDATIASGLTDNIRIFATYTAEAHKFVTVEDPEKTWAATCVKEGQTTEECSVCGEVKVTTLPMVDHTYVLQEDGSKVCSVCGDKIEAEVKEVTLTFIHGDNKTTSVKRAEGKSYTITAEDKSATAEFEYTFAGWKDEDGNIVSTEKEFTVTAGASNATYEADYTASKRTYRVTYVTDEYITLQSFATEFEYGADIPAYTNAEPTKKRDANYHYTFSGWSEDTTGTVTGDMMIIARFEGEKHNLNATVSTEATCTTPATTYRACDGKNCDYREALTSTGETIPHTVKEGTYEETPAGVNDGSKSFTCAMCGQKITEKIPANKEEITIVIYDNNGKLATVGSAHVSLYEIVDGTEVFYVGPRDTDANGMVKFEVEKGKKWKAAITGDAIEGGYGGEVKAGMNTFGKLAVEEEKPAEPSCGCSCHKDTFWGMIYRFFQKLVMWLTGNPKCCGDPDPRIAG